MNSALELHDSEVQSVSFSGSELRVLFAKAYVHKSAGVPGVDPGAGFVQAAECVFSEAEWFGLSPACAGQLSDGLLVIEERKFTLIPLPLSRSGSITAKFIFSTGAKLSVKAKAVSVSTSGQERFVENYA